MDHYRKQLLISAPPAAVYRAIATQEGLRAWWSEACTSASAVGGLATFDFGRIHKEMRITRLEANREVRWHCLQANIEAPGITEKHEWVGTDIVFKLAPQGAGKTMLDFEHIGLTPALQCYQLCDGGWNYFLGSLQSLAETGQGTPYKAQEGMCASQKALATA
jgi:uncharacterized protein YndB with AHSA1/START domain